MRTYIRHPFDITMRYALPDTRGNTRKIERQLKDICEGGLCFTTSEYIPTGSRILIEIPIQEPAFEATGIVAWCHHHTNDCYDIGVEFEDDDLQLHLRIVEQACHIKHYMRKEQRMGRNITGNQAAQEWVSKYSDDFPSLWNIGRYQHT